MPLELVRRHDWGRVKSTHFIHALMRREGIVDRREAQQHLAGQGSRTPRQAVSIAGICRSEGGARLLAIPAITDRVCRTAAKLVLEPIFEADSRGCCLELDPTDRLTSDLIIKREAMRARPWVNDDIRGSSTRSTWRSGAVVACANLRPASTKAAAWLARGPSVRGSSPSSPGGRLAARLADLAAA